MIEAAGALLLEGGFDAVRHRAVADRAELPLASTTYYFGSLEDLMAEAATFVRDVEERAMSDRVGALSRRRRGTRATADALAETFVGADVTTKELATRYETLALAARYPRLSDVVAQRQSMLQSLHTCVLEKSGRRADPAHIRQLIAVEDGAVMGSLGLPTVAPIDATRAALAGVVDVLAPRR